MSVRIKAVGSPIPPIARLQWAELPGPGGQGAGMGSPGVFRVQVQLRPGYSAPRRRVGHSGQQPADTPFRQGQAYSLAPARTASSPAHQGRELFPAPRSKNPCFYPGHRHRRCNLSYIYYINSSLPAPGNRLHFLPRTGPSQKPYPPPLACPDKPPAGGPAPRSVSWPRHRSGS